MYECSARGGLADTAPSGRVRLDTVARWIQDAARADVDDTGEVEDWLWIVRRLRLRVERFPHYGEPCTVRTWCSGLGSVLAQRRTTITAEGGGHVEAVALWVCMDAERGRPTSPSSAFLAFYEEAAAGNRVRGRLRHPLPPAEVAAADRSSWRFRAADLDMAAHVNNAAYWEVVEEELQAGAEPSRFDGEIEFRGGAQAGEAMVLRDGAMRWIVGDDGAVTASVLLDSSACSA